MRLKSQIGKLVIIALSVCSMSAYAAAAEKNNPPLEYFQNHVVNQHEAGTIHEQFSIVNGTSSILSFTVNGNCSQEIGIVNEIESRIIPRKTFNKICQNYAQPCTITAYQGKHCTGKSVGGVTYNNENNFIVTGSSNGISVASSGYTTIFYATR